MAKYAAVKKCL